MSIFATDTLGQMQEVAVLAAASYELALNAWTQVDDQDGTIYAIYIAARECKWKTEQMVREEKVRIEVEVKMAAWKKAS